MSNVPGGLLEAICTALIVKNGEAVGMEEAAQAAWDWFNEPDNRLPVFAPGETAARNALRQIGEVAVPPNATAAEVMAVVREIQAIAAKGLGK
jgi:uroporphyrinogen-III synthase